MISVIIPVYNAGNYLSCMIQCLQHQSYSNFEVILIDDGSQDESSLICDTVVENDNRFHVTHQENQGVSAARNRGISIANGEYITFLDADDEIPENYLEELIETQQKYNADIVVCDVVIIQGNKESKRFTCRNSVLKQKDALNLLLSRKQINSGPCAKLFCKSILNGALFPSLRAYEDILFIKDVFSHAEKIAVADQTEYRYLQNANSAMQHFAKTPSSDIIYATEELIKFIKNRQDLSSECMYITISHLFQYVQSILKYKNKEYKNKESSIFIQQTRKLYLKYLSCILTCNAFPWKEKLVFIAFIFGIYRRG